MNLGATVGTVGFPDPLLQGFAPKEAKGEIASLTGIQDDPRWFQISTPVQPGNSGSALVDARGNVVGVVWAKLDLAAAVVYSGTLPENVNYAIKSSFLLSFLESVPGISAKLKETNNSARNWEDVVKSAQDAAVMLLITQGNIVQENPSDRVASGNARGDGSTFSAEEFEREFYAKNQDLRPYAAIANWAANQVVTSGLRGTEAELIQAFSKATRGEIQRFYQRVEAIRNSANNSTTTPSPYQMGSHWVGGPHGFDAGAAFDAQQAANASRAAHERSVAANKEANELIKQEAAKYALAGRQVGLGEAALLALATPEEAAAAAAARKIVAQREQQKNYLAQSNAVRWLQPQASNGSASAQCSLGLHYLNGQGCDVDQEQAIYWLQKAAAQGDVEASNKLVSLKK